MLQIYIKMLFIYILTYLLWFISILLKNKYMIQRHTGHCPVISTPVTIEISLVETSSHIFGLLSRYSSEWFQVIVTFIKDLVNHFRGLCLINVFHPQHGEDGSASHTILQENNWQLTSRKKESYMHMQCPYWKIIKK